MVKVLRNGSIGNTQTRTFFLATLLLMALLALSSAQAAVWYVNGATSSPAPDGKTWATAYPTIQPAVNAAVDGDELWVAKGSYTGTDTALQVVNFSSNKSYITLYGGFLGVEPDRGQRDWTANPTIIDGQQTRRCVNTVASGNTLDGFLIQNGKAGYGAGLSGGMVANCRLTGNKASGYSGAMHGGTATNCIFAGNAAGSEGGGMYYGNATNCTFVGNSANMGGGMFYGNATNCIFWGNTNQEVNGTTVSYSCLPLFTPGAVNIVANPLFVNAAAGDFRLLPQSSCVNAGVLNGAPSTDFLGIQRPQGGKYDIGAYEMLQVAMPELSGFARRAAEQWVAAAHLYVREESEAYDPTIEIDHVIGHTPPAGEQVLSGTPVDLIISKGPQPVAVPDLVGKALDTATAGLINATLVVGTVTEQYSLAVPAGVVFSQSVAAGMLVLPGTVINLLVSKGGIATPDLAGKTQGEAAAALTGAALVVGTVTQQYSLTVPVGTVISQTPLAGTPLLPGTPIDLVVSKGGIPTPDLAGKTQGEAAAVLTAAGLAVGTVTQQYSLTVPVGTVISQTPLAGTLLLPGTPVDLVVSRGGIPTPNLAGKTQGKRPQCSRPQDSPSGR